MGKIAYLFEYYLLLYEAKWILKIHFAQPMELGERMTFFYVVDFKKYDVRSRHSHEAKN